MHGLPHSFVGYLRVVVADQLGNFKAKLNIDKGMFFLPRAHILLF